MANQYVNKLVKDGVTKFDLTSDTVTAETLKSGYTAHNAAGQKITGTLLSQPTTATAETIKEGFTAYNSNGDLITGSAAVSSWAELQQKVRNNDMDDISIGDQYGCFKGTKGIIFDVVGKDVDTPANPNYTHSLSLRIHELLPDALVFDNSEAAYFCENALPAGQYNLGIRKENEYYASYYKFTLTQAVPAGGQLVAIYYNNMYSTPITNIKSYASGSDVTPIEIVRAKSGDAGTGLGVLYVAAERDIIRGNVNAYRRSLYGSNNWGESAIRQWLNSDKPAGQWWEPQTPWDRPTTYAETTNGFLYDLDADFLNVVGKTRVTTKLFNAYTNAIDGTYTTEDFFFLVSQSQISSSYSGEGSEYPYYSDGSSRIMYKNGSASSYWLRTPNSDPCYVMQVDSDGPIQKNYANQNDNVAIICNII